MSGGRSICKTIPLVWCVVCKPVRVCCLPSELSIATCIARPLIKPGGSLFCDCEVTDLAQVLFKSLMSEYDISCPHW